MSDQSNNSKLPDSTNTAIDSDPDFLDFLLIISKSRKLIFCVTFGVAIVTIMYSLTLTKIYTAKTIIVGSDEEKGMSAAFMGQLGALGGAAALSGLAGTTKTDLYVTMLKTDTIRDQIIDRFNLMESYKVKYRAFAYKRLAERTRIELGKKDGAVTISVDDKDPRKAAEIANAYAEELGKMAAGVNMSRSSRNRQFLEERLADTKINLAKAEDSLRSFQSKTKMFDVPEQAKISISGVAQLRASLAVQELQLAMLKTQFTDSSSEVKAAVAAVANLKAQISKLEGGSGSSSIPSVGLVPELGQEYVRLLREFKTQEAMFEMLTKQYEMARFSEAKDVSPVQVIQKANIPEFKSKPSRAKIVIKMTILALFLSVGYVICRRQIALMSETDRCRWKTLISSVPLLRRWIN